MPALAFLSFSLEFSFIRVNMTYCPACLSVLVSCLLLYSVVKSHYSSSYFLICQVHLWSSLVAQRICLQCGRPGFNPWVGKSPWRRERLPTPVFWPRKFHRLYSPGVAKSRTRLRDFHFQAHLWAFVFEVPYNCNASPPIASHGSHLHMIQICL